MSTSSRGIRIPLADARSILAQIWFTGAGAIFLLLMVQSILNKYDGVVQEVWAWFLPAVLPTLSLMIGVLGAGALGKNRPRYVRRDFTRLSARLSIAYLLVLGSTILLEPLSPLEPLPLFTMSNYWLGPFQGLVVAAIGFIFTSQETAEKESEVSNRVPAEPAKSA